MSYLPQPASASDSGPAEEWGKEKPISSSIGENVRDLFDAGAKPEHALDDRTWADLNMDVVFGQVDRTLTYPGKQVLYQILRTPCLEYGPELQERAKAIRCFQANKSIREHIQLALHKMGDRGKHNLAALLWDQVELTVRAYCPVHSHVCAGPHQSCCPASGKARAARIVLVFAANMALHYGEQKRNRGHFESVKAVASLIRCGEELCRSEQDWNALSPLLLELKEVLPKVRGFRKPQLLSMWNPATLSWAPSLST